MFQIFLDMKIGSFPLVNGTLLSTSINVGMVGEVNKTREQLFLLKFISFHLKVAWFLYNSCIFLNAALQLPSSLQGMTDSSCIPNFAGFCRIEGSC